MNLIKKFIIMILTWEARLILNTYKPFIVAVTGSVGKTSTKDAIYEVLKHESRYVRKSEKSMNSELGLPLTIIGAANAWHNAVGWSRNIMLGLRLILRRHEYPDCLILEVGADHPGDIRNIVSWLKPDIAVITKVSATPVHVEFFSSPEQVFEEKASLADGVKKGGKVVLYADDQKVMSIAERPGVKGESVVTFGHAETATVKGSLYEIRYFEADGQKAPTGFMCTLSAAGTSYRLACAGMIGETYEYPLLAAAAVGIARGIPLERIVQSLSAYKAPPGRLNIIAGAHGSTIIDDTYNSSPDAALAALDALASVEAATKAAILGDMMELGKYSAEEHRRVGQAAARLVTKLITVGQRSRVTADEALNVGLAKKSVQSFDSADEAARAALPLAKSGAVILVKGSQSMRMERIVKALMAEPDKAPLVLVRQEQQWLGKK